MLLCVSKVILPHTPMDSIAPWATSVLAEARAVITASLGYRPPASTRFLLMNCTPLVSTVSVGVQVDLPAELSEVSQCSAIYKRSLNEEDEDTSNKRQCLSMELSDATIQQSNNQSPRDPKESPRDPAP
jgi:hypothetical protein